MQQGNARNGTMKYCRWSSQYEKGCEENEIQVNYPRLEKLIVFFRSTTVVNLVYGAHEIFEEF